jgi:hypothetical protein
MSLAHIFIHSLHPFISSPTGLGHFVQHFALRILPQANNTQSWRAAEPLSEWLCTEPSCFYEQGDTRSVLRGQVRRTLQCDRGRWQALSFVSPPIRKLHTQANEVNFLSNTAIRRITLTHVPKLTCTPSTTELEWSK